jgi:hypothetical protein
VMSVATRPDSTKRSSSCTSDVFVEPSVVGSSSTRRIPRSVFGRLSVHKPKQRTHERAGTTTTNRLQCATTYPSCDSVMSSHTISKAAAATSSTTSACAWYSRSHSACMTPPGMPATLN